MTQFSVFRGWGDGGKSPRVRTAKKHKNAKTGDYDDGFNHELAEVSGGFDDRAGAGEQ